MGLLKEGLKYVGKKASDYSKRRIKKDTEKTRKKLDKLEQKQTAEKTKLNEKVNRQKKEFQDLVIKSNPKAAKNPEYVKKIRGYKKGGMVKKCRMDGIALRGKTRAKERSK
mgnify:CR=1 FL=1